MKNLYTLSKFLSEYESCQNVEIRISTNTNNICSFWQKKKKRLHGGLLIRNLILYYYKGNNRVLTIYNCTDLYY